MLMDTISEILGKRVDSDLAKAVKESINSFEYIGSNGAGKSTLLNIIPRTWLVDSGKIILDDVDISNLAGHQDPMMGTAANMQIEENLLLRIVEAQNKPFLAN